jgi:folate-binding protein YgfZ
VSRPAPADLAQSYSLIREGACALETGRDVVLVRGRDARSWLQGQLSQDLQPLATGDSAESLVLSPQGKVDAYCRATVLADDVVLLDTEGGQGEVLFERLRRFRLRVKAELELGTIGCVMVRGPGSPACLERAAIRPGELSGEPGAAALGERWVVAVPVAWPGYAGFDLLGPVDAPELLELDVATGDPGAFEAARIEAGLPAMGRELTEKTIPQEAGSLVEHAVSFTKGCYTGQELVARLDARGGNVARRLRGVVLGTTAAEELPSDTVLVSGDREVGRLTSVAWSPGFGAPVALGYVRRDVVPPLAARLTPGGASAEIRELPLLIG